MIDLIDLLFFEGVGRLPTDEEKRLITQEENDNVITQNEEDS